MSVQAMLEVPFLASSVTLAHTFGEQNYFLMANAEFGLNKSLIMFLLVNIICVFRKYLSIKVKNKKYF
jgi:hypothetical protein